jgi:hypothetical protein
VHLVKEKLIKTDSQQLELLISKMDHIKGEFVSEFGEFTSTWIKERHQKMINSIPEITRKLENEELGEINQMVEEIIDTSSKRAKDLANQINWWHMSRNEIESDYYKKVDNLFGEEYGRIIGEIGSPLQEFGYLPKQKMPKFGFSFYRDRTNRHRYLFADPIDWSNKLKRLLDNYNDCYHSAIQF